MSVTITIEGNREYCDNKGLVQVEEYNCQTADMDGSCNGCVECRGHGGKGKVRFPHYPYEMNLANANFSTLWNSLALETGDGGEMDARTLKAALRNFDPALVERATNEGTGERGARFIDCGIDRDRALNYLTRLCEIAAEAERREALVIWH